MDYRKNALRTRLGMKVFHAMLRSLNVIIQKGWGCEDSSWVLLRNKFTVGRMATKPYFSMTGSIPWGSWRWTCLFLKLPSNCFVVMSACSLVKTKDPALTGLSDPFLLPCEEQFPGSQAKQIIPLDFFCGTCWGWGTGAGTKPGT